jgi:L-aminopeptidase/D-esterase-like protein
LRQLAWFACLALVAFAADAEPRARDLGIPFDGSPGVNNAITDVPGVEVGFKTLISGDGALVRGKGPVRTGVTAILPRGKADGRAVFPKLVSIADGLDEEHRGSIIIVIATDAPLTPDQLKRLARRSSVGLGRLGAIESDGSGDIFIAFSTANPGADDGNWATDVSQPAPIARLRSEALNPLFEATVQGVEEAVVNALVAARTMTGADYWTVAALPHDQLQRVLEKHQLLQSRPR